MPIKIRSKGVYLEEEEEEGKEKEEEKQEKEKKQKKKEEDGDDNDDINGYPSAGVIASNGGGDAGGYGRTGLNRTLE
ncbi:hypothetical protein E2C01_002334 [Portunus trituberculatus]|uniref:Uncharacterized protein n=1 Tax=Portunus trituberculatus TaxID=210409 RepID=A0A5B7CN05_PORTR|nr:hypothetical protein [Portunus trituberculatus]